MFRALVLAVTAWMLVAGIALAQNQRPLSPGLQPYTPTKLEWLQVVLQANLRQIITEHSEFGLEVGTANDDTIIIFVRYLPTVDRSHMNSIIDGAKKVVRTTAEGYGWTWVKIKEDVQALRPGRR